MERVALPEVVGVGFGEGEAGFGAGVTDGFEQFEIIDDTTDGVGCYLRTLEEALLDAGAVNRVRCCVSTIRIALLTPTCSGDVWRRLPHRDTIHAGVPSSHFIDLPTIARRTRFQPPDVCPPTTPFIGKLEGAEYRPSPFC